MRYFIQACAVLASMAGGAQAATLNESDIAGGFGSANQYFNPTYTPIGYGFDTVSGSLSANSFDFLQFTNLDAGAQTISLTFNLDLPAVPVYVNGGGALRYSDTYQSNPYGGTAAGNFALEVNPFNLPGTPSTTVSFSLANSFAGGDLFVTLLPTYGNTGINYSVALSGNGGGIAPVPVPATGLLLLGALGMTAVARRRRAPAPSAL